MTCLLKRWIDVGGAFLGLLLAWPVMVAVAVVVLISMGRPFLFQQVRPGLRGRPFTLLKFRTMSTRKDESGQDLPDGQRLTRVGRFLRSTSLDELPQLVNVLLGDMSFVGPRPLLMEYLDRYSERQAKRHDVRPGITGWAQVNGRNAASWSDRLEMDAWYAENACLTLDLKILGLTFLKVFQREGVAQDGHATCEKFMGNSIEHRKLASNPSEAPTPEGRSTRRSTHVRQMESR